MSSTPNNQPDAIMWLTRKYGFGNATVFGEWTWRTVGSYIVVLLGAWFIFRMPVFAWNWLVILGYIALCSILIGETPTKRNTLTNAYGIVARKPLRKVVTDHATTTTIGNGISEVIQIDGLNVPVIRANSSHYVLIYTITSNIGHWTSFEEQQAEAVKRQAVFTSLQPGERVGIIVSEDVDTGLLALADAHRRDDYTPNPELERMSRRRIANIDTKADGSAKSYQQHIVLYLKQENIRTVLQTLRHCVRTMRPANNPIDIWLSASGFEGGVRVDETTETDER